jgi:NADH dehydrogenase
VVIIGGGFGGLSAARGLADAPVDITLIDRTNHHVFQPLLYQVATASLAPSDITVPIRWVLRHQQNVQVMLANVTHVDTAARTLRVDTDPYTVSYDYLVVATGARHAYFGHDEWAPYAPGLKTLDDALEMRRRFLMAFELAESTKDEAERCALMTFVIVGGGPTGVELAGILHDVARALRKDFRTIDPTTLRVLLIEGGPRVLPTFPAHLSARAARDLAEFGVEVRTNAMATNIDGRGVMIGDEFIAARTVFWAAGNRASSLGSWLSGARDRAGRVPVQPTLQVEGHPEVFVVGDLAAADDGQGKSVPGVAPAATQMGALAAKNIVRMIDRAGQPLLRFAYLNKGELATIGRHRAVANFGGITLQGYIAWFFWLFVHIMYLVGFRNRAVVLLQWGYMYLTYQRGVRLIMGSEVHGPPVTGEWTTPELPR